MAADLAAFRERFPEAPFQPLPDPDVQQALSDALLLHDKSEAATLLAAAHILVLRLDAGTTADGGSGLVASEQVGPRRIQYLNQSSKADWRAFFETTTWGREFLIFERRTARAAIGAMVV